MSSGAEELARLREALGPVAEKARPTGDCPNPETIWAAVQGELPPGEMRAVVDHVAGCLVCAEAWELADDVDASRQGGVAGSVASIDVRPSLPAASPQPLRWLSVAAAVVLLIVGARWLPWHDWTTGSGYRSPESGALRSLVGEDEPLSRSDCVLRWQGPEDVQTFDLRVSWLSSGGRQVLFEVEDLEEAEVRIPEDLLQALPAGTKLVWRVEAFTDGRRVAAKSFVSPLE